MNENILLDAVAKAKKFGAEHVDIIARENDTISAVSRLTKLEQLTEASVEDIQIRAAVGKQLAVAGTNSAEDLIKPEFIEQLVSAAKNAPEDEFACRPNEEKYSIEQLDIYDDRKICPQDFVKYAIECEQIALDTAGITNSEGAEFGYTRSAIILLKDNDFCGKYRKTLFQASVVPLAEKNGELQQDYSFTQGLFFENLKPPAKLAEDAASRTLKKLGSRKISSCTVPVLFDRRCAGGLLQSILQAVNGANVVKGMSFLKTKLQQKIMPENVSVCDSYKCGINARPFDSEGLRSQNNNLIVEGVLQNFLLNTRYANQLKMFSTHSASGFNSIAPNNVYMKNGTAEKNSIICGIKRGLLITETMGGGLNIVTGNYSTGACGFWIENGMVQYPVNEITLAGNFDDMFENCILATDLQVETGCDSPSIFIPNMVIGGK